MGPYVFISGQIGLLPPSLTLPSPSSFALETALVFQHTDRVIRAANYAGGHIMLSMYWLVDKADVVHVRWACEQSGEVSRELYKKTVDKIINHVGNPNAVFGRRVPPAWRTYRETGLGAHR